MNVMDGKGNEEEEAAPHLPHTCSFLLRTLHTPSLVVLLFFGPLPSLSVFSLPSSRLASLCYFLHLKKVWFLPISLHMHPRHCASRPAYFLPTGCYFHRLSPPPPVLPLVLGAKKSGGTTTAKQKKRTPKRSTKETPHFKSRLSRRAHSCCPMITRKCETRSFPQVEVPHLEPHGGPIGCQRSEPFRGRTCKSQKSSLL